ncbi:glycosyltransferase 1 domain-containing protein 1 isoform X4 [Parambassis ranga]|uniref:Glycosyltransferase 1 domain-containing protein 1 isoform X4 n=1 Tax=Parambassis ranga TaxID=210632 RepID=A0A6P7J1Z8_9TELE|nr:glycosyltransferase 1 domain-containing protein 1 isoform X4 [Parambassis ranga]
MKLLFLAALNPKTGNHTTAERIRSHIESAGHTCELRDAGEFHSSADVANLVSQNSSFEGALAIHLFRAGRLLLDIQIPYGVVFGGTDINEDVKVEQKRVVMEQVLLKARFAVAFTEKLKEEAEIFLVSQTSKIYIQPQGIQTEAVEKFCWAEFLRNSGVICENVDELHVFLLVCGLRRVKDPLYLVEVFSGWHCENLLNVLVIIGPKEFRQPLIGWSRDTSFSCLAGINRQRGRKCLQGSVAAVVVVLIGIILIHIIRNILYVWTCASTNYSHTSALWMCVWLHIK